MIDLVLKAGGNASSIKNFLRRLEIDFRIVNEAKDLSWKNPILIPGVGSFGAVMDRLNENGLSGILKAASISGIPILGICSGMQILFDSSEETPGVKGLGLIPGSVVCFKSGKVPNIGWSKLTGSNEYVYFVNSYYAETECISRAVLRDGCPFPAIVTKGTVTGFQFHPEKSHRDGEILFRRWLDGL